MRCVGLINRLLKNAHPAIWGLRVVYLEYILVVSTTSSFSGARRITGRAWLSRALTNIYVHDALSAECVYVCVYLCVCIVCVYVCACVHVSHAE